MIYMTGRNLLRFRLGYLSFDPHRSEESACTSGQFTELSPKTNQIFPRLNETRLINNLTWKLFRFKNEIQECLEEKESLSRKKKGKIVGSGNVTRSQSMKEENKLIVCRTTGRPLIFPNVIEGVYAHFENQEEREKK